MEHGASSWLLGGWHDGFRADISAVCSVGRTHRGYSACHGGTVGVPAYAASPLVSFSLRHSLVSVFCRVPTHP